MDISQSSGTQKRVVISGAGFAGLTLAQKLSKQNFQIVLVDKNNYHQFQPLLYQVATAGLEPSSISFPLRKIFQNRKNVFIRIAEVLSVRSEEQTINTSEGPVPYDYLVLANGAVTNFFGNEAVETNSFSMKSLSEALLIRNSLLQNYEKALITKNEEEKETLLSVVIAGGGPTGVELAGAVAEMKNKLLPKDFPELNFSAMQIFLVEASPDLLGVMKKSSSETVKKYLEGLGVKVLTGTALKSYDGKTVVLSNGNLIHTYNLIWAAGVKGASLEGIPEQDLLPDKRIRVDVFNRLKHHKNIFAIGDIACMMSENFPKGHPQIAPVAIQQAKLLAKNFKRLEKGKPLVPFIYKDRGSMATAGRNLAVAEVAGLKMKGFFAWAFWMLVHLMSVIGAKNRLFILINWIWQYITYDQSLRLIIKPVEKKGSEKKNLAGAALSLQIAGNVKT